MSADCDHVYQQQGRMREIIRAYGAEHVLFGTDYPFWPQKAEIEIKNSEFTENEAENGEGGAVLFNSGKSNVVEIDFENNTFFKNTEATGSI